MILIDNENYLPNILKRLWAQFSRDEIYQPNRYQIDIAGDQTDLKSLVIDVRDNPGGYLLQTQEILSLFFPNTVMV